MSVDPGKDLFGAFILLASMCSFACCNGDTWASEVGPVISNSSPRLITTWEVVPKGTNGGITLLGTVASGLGGLIVGAAFGVGTLFAEEQQTSPTSLGIGNLALLGMVGGLLGSAIDSVLGATVQYSGQEIASGKIVDRPGKTVRYISGSCILDNHLVNLYSSLLTGLIVSAIQCLWYM